MEFKQGEVIELTDADWAEARAHQSHAAQQNEARLKGLAIDAAIKRLMGEQTQERLGPIDAVLDDIEIKHQEFKSTRGGAFISLSPKEKERADEKLALGEDTLIWIFDQGDVLNTFKLTTIVRYSKLALYRSQYDMWVRENNKWLKVKGWFFYRKDAIRNGEKLD